MLRRTAWRWLAVAALALSMTAVAIPATASAEDALVARCAIGAGYRCMPPAAAADNAVAPVGHIGWTFLNLNYCPPGMGCIALYRDSMSAWSWSGTAWRPSTLRQGWVYVYPYTGAWRWAWTQETGWVAVTGGRFELRRF